MVLFEAFDTIDNKERAYHGGTGNIFKSNLKATNLAQLVEQTHKLRLLAPDLNLQIELEVKVSKA